MNTQNILLAGATGYLGQFLAEVLQEQGYDTTLIVRNTNKLRTHNIQAQRVIQAELTKAEQLIGCCQGIDIVISTVGITKQKDGLSYMEVDYQANMNLLEEAKRAGVSKFVYIASLHGDKMTHLDICAAKERFVQELKASGLDYCIIRPNGFFSDMGEFFEMAKKGRVYLFGNGQGRVNPIHGYDLATFCIEHMQGNEQELDIGGPEILTQNEIAQLAFATLNKPTRISYIPNWLRRSILFLGKYLMPSKVFGPIEFFLTVLAMDMVAPTCGERTLREHFEELHLSRESSSEYQIQQ